MRKYVLPVTASCLALVFSACSSNQKKSPDPEKKLLATIINVIPEKTDGGNEEEKDGIRESMLQDIENTKDLSLGYVPLDRLIQADEQDRIARRNGTFVERMEALSWTERGSNTDAVGPSNGNLRYGSAVTSGRMRAVWVDLADATNRTVWVGGVDGGIWSTTNITTSPATWTLANDFVGNLAVSSICQDPTNTNTMYFSTGEKSPNVDAVQGGGVWKSTDHGVTWNLLGSTTGFQNISKMVCDASGNIYLGTIASLSTGLGTNGLFRSTNGGTSWTNISPAGLSARIPELEISSTGRLHITAGYYNTAPASAGYRYTDNPSTVTSATWTSPTTSFSPIEYNVDIAVAGTTLYALPAKLVSTNNFQTDQVWKSTDGGDNWAITTTTPTIGGGTPVSSGQAWYNLAIGVDPTNANNVMVGGLNSYLSTDGGATWAPNSVWINHPSVPGSTNYVHADHHIIVWNDNQVLDGGDGGIFYSANDGATWADRNVGLRLKQFYSGAIHPTSTNYFLAGAQDNGVHQFNGAGLTGSVEVTGGDGAFTHIDEDEPSIQFGSYTYNDYRRSLNGGASWGGINFGAGGQFINPTDYDDINNKMYGPWGADNYFRWNNAATGTSAELVPVTGLNGGLVNHAAVSRYTPNRVFFGGTTGAIIRVDNAHTTPVATTITGSGMSAARVSCIAQGTSDNNLLATFSNYGSTHVWVTTTGGGAAGWTNITGTGLPDIPVRWAMFHPEDNTKAILATEMGIFETDLINGASTVWVRNSTFPVVRTDMLQFRYRDNTILAATHGRGLWTSVLPVAAPYVRFNSSYTYSSVKTEGTASTTGCRFYTDYTLNMHIDQAPTGAAAVTLNIAGGATATQGIDFDFTTNGNFAAPSNVLTFPNGSTADQPITIRVYNNAEIENAESFTFTYTIGGGTDAVAAPSSSSYTFHLGDNDVAPSATPIETVLNNNRTEYVANNGTYYFYSTSTGNLISRLAGVTANTGCVTANIFEAGTTWQTFAGGQRSQKVFDINPAANPSASYTIGLYFTAAELAGKDPATLRIAKTSAATMAGANSGNTLLVTTTFATYNGGYVFTASFAGFSKFFLADAGVTLPVDLVSFSGSLNAQRHTDLQWQTTNQYNMSTFEIQRSYDGINFTVAGNVAPVQSPTSIQHYQFTDPSVAKPVNFYRLKMIDQDGRFKYSAIVKINNDKPANFVQMLQNPVRDNINFLLNNNRKENVSVQLINMAGQVVKRWELGKVDGNILLPFNGAAITTGVYTLRIAAGQQVENLKISKQ